MMGWTEDRAVHYAKERAYDAAARPLLPYTPAIGQAIRAYHGAQNLRDGILLSGGRDEAGKPLSQIGGELFLGVADRQRAATRISKGFHALAADIDAWFKANPSSSRSTSPIAQWIADDVTPALKEWNQFVATDDKSWWTKSATNWETFEGWQNRLRQLRSVARAHSITLESPEPEALPKAVWQRSAVGKIDEGAALLGALKIAAAAVLGISGFVALYGVVRGLRAPTQEHGAGQIPVQVQATP